MKFTNLALKQERVETTNRMRNRVLNCAACIATAAACLVPAYAVTIDTNYSVGNLQNLNPEGLILGIAFWLCRLIGISMFIFGIYGFVTARKDGEAESMNGAIGKLVSGIVLLLMPTILKGMGII